MPRHASPWPWLFAGWAVLVALALATRSLVPVDETRYVAVAWHMWRRGDLLLPWLAGEAYPHKPPLLFWIIHAGWAVFGVNEWWPRLISPLCALASAALLARLARALWPLEPALGGRAALVLAGGAVWAVYTTATMFDLLLSVFALLGILGLVTVAQGRARRGAALVAVALAGGLLTKGPVILLHLAPPALLWRWWNPGGGATRRPWWLLCSAFALGVGVALAWAVPAALHGGPAYRDAILWGQTAGRVVAAFDHAHPPWWYLPWLPLLLFPWSVWPPAWRGIRALARVPGDPAQRLLLAWGVPAFLLLSVISGKQLHYLLALWPPLALLLARGLSLAGPTQPGDALPAAGVGAAFGAALLGAGAWLPATDGVAPWLSRIPTMWLLVPLAWAVAVAWPARRPGGAGPAQMSLAGAVLAALLQATLFLAAGPAYDTRPAARHLAAAQAEGRPLALVDVQDHGSFDFAARLRQPLQPVPRDALDAWFAAHPQGLALVLVRARPGQAAGPARWAQPFRGRFLVLVEAAQWPAWRGAAH